MEFFAEITNDRNPLRQFTKSCISDVRQGSEYASEILLVNIFAPTKSVMYSYRKITTKRKTAQNKFFQFLGLNFKMIIFLEDKVKTGALIGILLFIFVFSVGSLVLVIWRQFRRYKKRLAMRDHYLKIGEQQETKIMFKK